MKTKKRTKNQKIKVTILSFLLLCVLLKLNIISKLDEFNLTDLIINKQIVNHLLNWQEVDLPPVEEEEGVEPQSVEEQVVDRPPVQEESHTETKTSENKDYDDEDEYEYEDESELEQCIDNFVLALLEISMWLILILGDPRG